MDFIKRILGLGKPPTPAASTAPGNAGQDERLTRWRDALQVQGFPYRIIPYARAMKAITEEDRIGAREGFTPVFIVPGYWNSPEKSVEKRIRTAEKHLRAGISPEEGRAVLAARFARLPEDMEDDPECPDPALFDALKEIPVPPDHPGVASLTWYDSGTRQMRPVPEVAIARIPTREHYAIPLYLDWGGWNDVPSSYELAAVARYWQETHGARLAAVGSDTLEFRVTRRLQSHAEAVALLKEQYAFSSDNWEFDQDMLEHAAAELRASDSWMFWWD